MHTYTIYVYTYVYMYIHTIIDSIINTILMIKKEKLFFHSQIIKSARLVIRLANFL